MKLSRRVLLADIGTYLAYAVIFLFFAGPLLWLLSLSIRNSSEIFVSDLRIIPENPTLENFRERAASPALSALPLERPEARGRRGLRRDALRHAGRLCLVAIPLPKPQPDDDRPPRLPDDLASGHHGSALSLHGPGRHDRQPVRRRAHLHRHLGSALHLDAEGLPRRHPAEPRRRRHDRRLHALGRLHARHPAAQPARPHLGFRAERHPRAGRSSSSRSF